MNTPAYYLWQVEYSVRYELITGDSSQLVSCQLLLVYVHSVYIPYFAEVLTVHTLQALTGKVAQDIWLKVKRPWIYPGFAKYQKDGLYF